MENPGKLPYNRRTETQTRCKMGNTDASLAERLVAEMARTGYNPTSLSLASNLGKNTVSDILEDPSRKPRKATIAKLARTLNVRADYLEGKSELPSELDVQPDQGLTAPGNTKLIQSIGLSIQSLVEREGEKYRQIYLDRGAIGLGIPPQSNVILDTFKTPLSGDVVVVAKGGVRVCYVAEPYLVSMDGEGGAAHFLNDDSVQVLGVVQMIARAVNPGIDLVKSGNNQS